MQSWAIKGGSPFKTNFVIADPDQGIVITAMLSVKMLGVVSNIKNKYII